jgi:hypothetical protein
MNFSLPKEFEQFVTNAEDLLKQFNGGTASSETVTAVLHWQNSSLQSAVRYHQDVTTLIASVAQDYCWHRDEFKLVITFDYEGKVTLSGSAAIGECIDDEWFIVYLLLLVSERLPELAISVADSDGQFLLMEAADHIEDWLGPDNADNRVWISRGRIHIIPLDEPGKLKSGGMKLDRALACIYNSAASTVAKSRTLASPLFHKAIHARTKDVYPAKVYAYRHTALCVLPAWLASLFAQHPQLVSRAVEAFSSAEKEHLRKVCSGDLVGQLQKAHSSTGVTEADQWVAASVHMTRALYAQLTFKNFHPPRKYHGTMRRMSAANSRKVNSAFDLGCRLACGIDCAYYASRLAHSEGSGKKSAGSSNMGNEEVWAEVVRLGTQNGYLGSGAGTSEQAQRESELRCLFDSKQLMSAANYERFRAGDASFAQEFCRCIEEAVNAGTGLAVVVAGQDNEAEADRALFRTVLDNTALPQDNDAWLYMTPEELDKELQARVDRFSTSPGSTSATNAVDQSGSVVEDPAEADLAVLEQPTPAQSAEEAEAQQLQGMLDGLKSFMAGSSDIDGVSFPANKEARSASKAPALAPSPAVALAAPAAPVAAQEGALALDYDHVQALLKSMAAGGALPSLSSLGGTSAAPTSVPTPDVSTEAESEEDKQRLEQKDLLRYFSQADMEEIDSEGGEEGGMNDEDSDSEDSEDDRDGERAADLYLREVLSSNNKSAFNKASSAKDSSARQPASAAPTSPLRPQQSAAVVSPSMLGVGGGYLRGGSGGGSAHRAVEELDSDDEVEEGATTAAPALATAKVASSVPRAVRGLVDSDDEDEDEDEGGFREGAGDSEADEEDLEGMYASLDPETIREFQVRCPSCVFFEQQTTLG